MVNDRDPAAGPSSESRLGAIQRLIGWCAANPFLVAMGAVALVAWGVMSLRAAPLDAIPDLSDAQVIVFTEWKGRSPDLIEDQITYPISSALLSAPKVKHVRGQSVLGLSFVNVVFEDGTDIYWARSRVLEYLNSAQGQLPAGVSPRLGPDASGVGWVFEYALVDRTGKHDLAELRALQDFHLRYALSSLEGVAEVATMGGPLKQYQVTVDPEKLLAHRVPIGEVVAAVRHANNDVGGRVIEIAGHEHTIRGRGYIRSKEDLELAPIRMGEKGVAVLLRDVAVVQFGAEMGRGVVELDGQGEAVGGLVVMRYGENALNVIERVKERLDEERAALPAGVELVVTYDRSDLIKRAIANLQRTLIEEMAVVSLVIALFLLHARSALVAIITLPIAVLAAFIPMTAQHLTANIMSLGGIAVAIGAMVDAAIIMIENAHRRVAAVEGDGPEAAVARRMALVRAMQEVGPSIFFALLVITVSFLPVFSLQDTEGRLFKPLAFTKTWSMAAAALLAVTLIPALAVLAMRGRMRGEDSNPLNRWLSAAYAPIARWVSRHPLPVIGAAVLAMVVTVASILYVPRFQLQSEFMPDLNEGAILYMPTSPPGMSITEATRLLQVMDTELKSFPEVQSVFGKMGSSETATDPAPLNMAETVVMLKPEREWRPGMTWRKLIDEMRAKLVYPGMPSQFWMPIQTRIDMLATGVRSPLAIKVYGSSIDEVERAGIDIEKALGSDPRTAGITESVFLERSAGGFFIDFAAKREQAARFGLSVDDVNEVVETAIGGMSVTQTVEGRERYPVNVRYARDFREDPDALARVLVPTPSGAQVPMSQVADIRFVKGPMMISSEAGKLVGVVVVNAKALGIPDYVAKARGVVDEHRQGTRVEWVGQFQHYQSAKARLRIVVPVTLFIVFMLLYLSTRSLIETGLVMAAVPFSLIGAVWILVLLHYKVSVAVWVGMIALAGLDAETGVIMLLFLTMAWRERVARGEMRHRGDLEEAIVEGSARRIRPKLMTVACLLIGLLPVMWSDGTGADVMKRIAAPMVGGIVTSFLLELAVYPAAFRLWKGRGLPLHVSD